MVTKSPQGVHRSRFFGKFLRKNLSAISTFLQILFVFMVSLFVVPLIVLPILVPIYTFRFILFKLTPLFRPSLGKMLSSQSAMFATDDIYNRPLCTPVGKCVYEGPVNLEKTRETIQKFWLDAKFPNGQLKHPELTQYITYYLGFPFWKDEKGFKLEDHVRMMDPKFIKSPDNIATDSEVTEYMSHLSVTPFEAGTSPWQVIVADLGQGPDNKFRYANITKWHHSLTDGLGLVKLYANSADIDMTSIPKSQKVKRQQNKFFHTLCHIVRTPFEAIKEPIESKDSISSKSWHLPESELKRKWTCAFSDDLIPSDLVKEIKNGYQVSFNAVIMTVITGAVRNFMLANKSRKMPDFIHAGVPIPTHGHPDKLRNSWSVCTVKLPVGEKDPVQRLHYIDRKLTSLKRSTIPTTVVVLMPFVGCLFKWMVKLFMKNRNTTMLLSVMPGPEKFIINNLGQKFVEPGFLVALGDGNTGFGMSSFTYCGHVTFGATVDHALLRSDPKSKSEVKSLANGACEELRQLKILMKSEV